MEENKKNTVIGVAEPVLVEVENIGVINPDILKKKAQVIEEVVEVSEVAAAAEVKEEAVKTAVQEPQQAQAPQQTQVPPVQPVAPVQTQNTGSSQQSLSDYDTKRILAGIMGILFGAFGVHNFIYGYTTKGIIQILLSTIGAIFTCGLSAFAAYVWGLVEGILILTDSIKPNN